MSELPPFSSKASNASERSPEERLKQGLAALKQKDYTTAIHCLSKLPQDLSASGTLRLKARMGLIRALKGNGQIAEAIAQCQLLVRHQQPKVQEWAKTTLAKLTAIASAQSSSASEANDLSGFQPLDSASAPASQQSDSVAAADSGPPGIAPPNTPNIIEPSPAVTAATILPDDSDTSTVSTPPPSSEKSQSDEGSQSKIVPPTSSLFHYKRLNDAPTPSTAPENIPPKTERASEASLLTTSPGASQSWQFQYAGRLQRLRLLPKEKWTLAKLWGIQALTVVALFWVSRAVVQWALTQLARVLQLIRGLSPVSIPLNWRYQEHTLLVTVGLVGLLLASPWLLDWLLRYGYNQKTLSIQKLKQTHPEGCRLLRRVGQQRGWQLPVIRELPTDAPLIFSYGWLPRYSRIVVSRGLLNRLEEDEFATLIGYELSHLTTWTLPVMSLIAALLQLLHQSYWQSAQWGDRHDSRLIKAIAAIISAVSYILYWIFHKVSIPFSRVRVHSCDRQAVEWTGNPNALMRSLIKLASGIADTLDQAGCTPPLIESTDLLTPYGYENAISIGSIYPDASFLQALNWDTRNPYRNWLSVNSSHPLLGARLKQLAAYALNWQLMPEVMPLNTAAQVNLRNKSDFLDYWLPFLQQISPYMGPLLGALIAIVFGFVGGIVNPLGIWQVSWLYGDESILPSSLLIGLGVGIMLRINRYFPDIFPASRMSNPALPSLLKNPMALPTDSRPLRLKGTLIGRRGIANWLCQDLILKTPTGLLKLHFLSSLGAVGNLLIHPKHPTDWVGKSIEVQGWFRRGAIAWLDIDQILKSGRVVARGNHPMLSVLLSLSACGLGLYILLRG